MYIRWKLLIGLGFMLWLMLCISDYFPVNHTNYASVQEKLTLKTRYSRHKKDEGSLELIKLISWNLIAFGLIITVCFLLKSISSRLNVINPSLLQGGNDKSTSRNTSFSRIPIPISNKSSLIDIRAETSKTKSLEFLECDWNKSCPNLLIFQRRAQQPKISSKNDKRIKIMENHCARLREEMINLQTTCLKEHSNIARKLEAVSKEKKDLIKQFNSISKENKSLKLQLNELTEEKTLLIKRLECATKEMKTATKNRKATIAKLDEAVANAETLKANLEQIMSDKVVLEDKLITLDAEYKKLKEEVELQREKETEQETNISDEKKSDASIGDLHDECQSDSEDRDEVTQTEEEDYVTRSEEDIKKVQKKLLSLEKSLVSFKLRYEHDSNELTVKNTIDEAEFELSKQSEIQYLPNNSKFESNSEMTLQEQLSFNSICTEPDCPLEHRQCLNAKCFLKRKLKESSVSTSGNDSSTLVQYKDYLVFKNRLKLKSSVSDDRLSAVSESLVRDDSGEDWKERKRRIVSQSPAFRKFLRGIIEIYL